jgi:hypothetical protein
MVFLPLTSQSSCSVFQEPLLMVSVNAECWRLMQFHPVNCKFFEFSSVRYPGGTVVLAGTCFYGSGASKKALIKKQRKKIGGSGSKCNIAS